MTRKSPNTLAKRVLIRATNWVGDAVMTLPAVDAMAKAWPDAELHVLAKPWVGAVYQGHPAVKRIVAVEEPGRHAGWKGRLALAADLRSGGYDMAVLLQNAFGAALVAWAARIPRRIGYSRDGRGLLLTTAVPCGADVRSVHETSYYLHMLQRAGVIADVPPAEGVAPHLRIGLDDAAWADQFIAEKGLGVQKLLGIAPGAAFGPAKCWPADKYAGTADMLADHGYGKVLLFGSKGEATATADVAGATRRAQCLDLAGQTSLGRALALLAKLDLFLTNDSGLMHAAAALGIPTVAVFGSTNPHTTGPLGAKVAIVRKPVDCAPCKKPECPTGDMRCFSAITPEDVYGAAQKLTGEGGVHA